MKRITFLLILIIAINFSNAQTEVDKKEDTGYLKGKHSFGFSIGMLSQKEVSVLSVNVKAEANFIGGIFYNYWLRDEWALELSAGVLNAEVFSGVSFLGIEQKAATVIPLLAGVRYYPDFAAFAENVRPYFSLLVGAHMGHSSSNKLSFGIITSTVTKVESVFAAKTSLGIDAFIESWLRIGLSGGYNFGSDFKEAVGTRLNYSGFELSINFGIIL